MSFLFIYSYLILYNGIIAGGSDIFGVTKRTFATIGIVS